MDKKVRIEFRLNNNSFEYLDNFANEKHINRTEALERIIMFHQEKSSDEIDIIVERLLSKYDEKYKNFFTRQRLATNYTEQNVQIVLQVLNSLLVHFDIHESYTTDIIKTPVLQESEEFVKKQIAAYKLNNDKNKRTNS